VELFGEEMATDISLHTFSEPAFAGVVKKAIEFFVSTPIRNLPPDYDFHGAGVYALYYMGDFEPYQLVSKANKSEISLPIYVGKAVPPGWRTARIRKSDDSRVLHNRICEHARSVTHTKSLDVKDFRIRFMILRGLEVDLVVPIEAELIRNFNPLWNSVIDGFGNHDPGSGRYNQAISEWDVIHPGRPWAKRLTGKAPKYDEIIRKLDDYTR
jgi:hypothetical protein